MVGQMPVEQARTLLQQMQQQEGSAPPERQKVLKVIIKLLQERIEKGGGER